jgi:hypothetical protein
MLILKSSTKIKLAMELDIRWYQKTLPHQLWRFCGCSFWLELSVPGFLEMRDPQVTTDFSKMLIHLDDDWGYPHDFRNLHMGLMRQLQLRGPISPTSFAVHVMDRRRSGSLGCFFFCVCKRENQLKLLWMVAKSCTTLGWNPINTGINHLPTGAGFLPSTVWTFWTILLLQFKNKIVLPVARLDYHRMNKLKLQDSQQ